jgi:hypothetical protein
LKTKSLYALAIEIFNFMQELNIYDDKTYVTMIRVYIDLRHYKKVVELLEEAANKKLDSAPTSADQFRVFRRVTKTQEDFMGYLRKIEFNEKRISRRRKFAVERSVE